MNLPAIRYMIWAGGVEDAYVSRNLGTSYEVRIDNRFITVPRDSKSLYETRDEALCALFKLKLRMRMP